MFCLETLIVRHEISHEKTFYQRVEWPAEAEIRSSPPREGVRTITAFDDYYHTQRIDQSISAQGKLSKQLNLNFLAAYNDFERIKESRIKDLVTLESKLRPEVQGNDVQDTSTFSLIMSRASVTTNLDSS